MLFLPVILVFQLTLSIFLLSHPSINQQANQRKVLGITKLAQDTTSDTSNGPTQDTSSESPSPASDVTSNNQANPTDQSQNNPTPTESPNSSMPDVTNQIFNSSSPSSENPLFPSSNPQSANQPEANQHDSSGIVLNPDETTSNPDNVNPATVKEAQEQDKNLDEANTPEVKADISIANALKEVKQIDRSVTQDNFADVNFVSQRFSNQIDETLNIIAQLPSDKAANLKQSLKSFCSQANLVLQSVQLSVPEESEPDLELDRAKCLNVTTP